MAGNEETRRQEFRSRIEAARAYAGISSQGKLAEAIGMKPGTFQRRLSGEYRWRRADVLAIAETCDVPVEFFERGFELKIQGEKIDPGLAVQDSAYLLSVLGRGGSSTSRGVDDEADLAEGFLERDRGAGEGERGHG